jgi:hypothetical protein
MLAIIQDFHYFRKFSLSLDLVTEAEEAQDKSSSSTGYGALVEAINALILVQFTRIFSRIQASSRILITES